MSCPLVAAGIVRRAARGSSVLGPRSDGAVVGDHGETAALPRVVDERLGDRLGDAAGLAQVVAQVLQARVGRRGCSDCLLLVGGLAGDLLRPACRAAARPGPAPAAAPARAARPAPRASRRPGRLLVGLVLRLPACRTAPAWTARRAATDRPWPPASRQVDATSSGAVAPTPKPLVMRVVGLARLGVDRQRAVVLSGRGRGRAAGTASTSSTSTTATSAPASGWRGDERVPSAPSRAACRRRCA